MRYVLSLYALEKSKLRFGVGDTQAGSTQALDDGMLPSENCFSGQDVPLNHLQFGFARGGHSRHTIADRSTRGHRTRFWRNKANHAGDEADRAFPCVLTDYCGLKGQNLAIARPFWSAILGSAEALWGFCP